MVEECVTLSKSQEDFLRKYMPNDTTSSGIANFFSVFSDNTRIRILSALAIADMCVGDLSFLLGINQSTISHQLKLLRDARIVECKRQGKLVVYCIVNPFVNDVMVTGVDNYHREKGMYNLTE